MVNKKIAVKFNFSFNTNYSSEKRFAQPAKEDNNDKIRSGIYYGHAVV
jgi:hypothetical protein